MPFYSPSRVKWQGYAPPHSAPRGRTLGERWVRPGVACPLKRRSPILYWPTPIVNATRTTCVLSLHKTKQLPSSEVLEGAYCCIYSQYYSERSIVVSPFKDGVGMLRDMAVGQSGTRNNVVYIRGEKYVVLGSKSTSATEAAM